MDEGGPSRKRAFPEDSSTQQKRVRFPKGKKAKTGDYVIDAESSEVLPGWKDPRLAATERRAVARNQLTAELLEELDGGEMLEDVKWAEIHYQDNETFVDDGVQMEPFNLEKEREEGYFDAEGNYVEFVNEDIKDAWLDSIDASRKIAPGNYVKPKNQDDAPDLSSGTTAEIKRRIADVLEPGETVLQALRRLKGTSNNRKEKMSAETKKIFDQLTEDAMRLLENGDYNVYDEKQETFHREAEGYEKLAEVRKQATSNEKQETFHREAEGYEKLAEAGKQATSTGAGPSVLDNSSEDAFDMFADEDGSAAINPGSDQNGPVSNTANQTSDGGYLQNDYVYDETSGYYYSKSLGYYYDPSTRLYCYAETGQWYSYNEESGAYEEYQQAAVSS